MWFLAVSRAGFAVLRDSIEHHEKDAGLAPPVRPFFLAALRLLGRATAAPWRSHWLFSQHLLRAGRPGLSTGVPRPSTRSCARSRLWPRERASLKIFDASSSGDKSTDTRPAPTLGHK